LIRLYYFRSSLTDKLHLRRGHIILIGGGAVTLISFVTFVYLIAGNTYSIKPNDRLVLRQFVSNTSQGVYSISFPLFEGQPNLKIEDSSNQTIVEKTIYPPIVSEVFAITKSGYYTLILANPSPGATLEVSILFGDQESYATEGLRIFSIMLYGGIITTIAGIVITVLDRRRISKMKQFGDTSDLV
jgi:hypothetical protein